jgi:ribonuclease HI
MLKWNVDGSSIGKHRLAGIGRVLCNHKGLVLGFFSAPVGIKDSNEFELLDVIKDLELSSSYDFTGVKFIFEYNYVVVVNLMNKPSNKS